MHQQIEDEVWVKENFGKASLGNKKRTARLLKITSHMVIRPDASIPKQMGEWGDVKAAYNFLSNPTVTHASIQEPHRQLIMNEILSLPEGTTVLNIQDGSEIDLTSLKNTTGLGPIGNHQNTGLMIHNCLSVVADSRRVLGLIFQQVWTRKDLSLNRKETRTQRSHRTRESSVWLKTLKGIGRPPRGYRFVNVGDRANDIFEFLQESKKLGWESVIRVNQNRKIAVDEQSTSLLERIRSLSPMGTKELVIRMRGDTKVRQVNLNVTWEKVLLMPPRNQPHLKPAEIWVIRVSCENEDLEWILYSTIPVNNLEDAIEKIEWYECRWIIEDFHKGLKTGCRVESSQLETGHALKNLLAILSIIAVKLLQLRWMARDDNERHASEVVPQIPLMIICKLYGLSKDMRLKDFWRSVAKLGGFLGRRSDGEPGWQTLWGGWIRLLDMWMITEALKTC